MKLVIDYPIEYTGLPFGDVTFILAPLLDNNKYVEELKAMKSVGRPTMFDNGAWEFGETMDIGQYLSLIKRWNPEYAVIPDVMKDCTRTIDVADRFLTLYNLGSKLPNTKLIFAPQGKNFMEMIDCYTAITNEWFVTIDMLGVPKHVGKWMNRISFTNELYEQALIKFNKVHFLGLWAEEDLTPHRVGDWKLESIDTKAPFKVSTKHKFTSQMEYYNWTGDFSMPALSKATQIIKHNVGEINDN